MSRIVVYTKPACPYSVRMMEFLRSKSVHFSERSVTEDDAARYEEFVSVTGEVEPPVLVIDNVVIGDYERVTSLDLQGKLDEHFGL